eukprot:scaffold223_cov408-Prasinococcus_capsulatus_cf.AAC.11
MRSHTFPRSTHTDGRYYLMAREPGSLDATTIFERVYAHCQILAARCEELRVGRPTDAGDGLAETNVGAHQAERCKALCRSAFHRQVPQLHEHRINRNMDS